MKNKIASFDKEMKEEIKKAFDNEMHNVIVGLSVEIDKMEIKASKIKALKVRYKPEIKNPEGQ